MHCRLSTQLIGLLLFCLIFAARSRAQTEGIYTSSDDTVVMGVSDNGNGTYHLYALDQTGAVELDTDVSSGLLTSYMVYVLGYDYDRLSEGGNWSIESASFEVDTTSGPDDVIIGYGIIGTANETLFFGRIGDLTIGDFVGAHAADNAADMVIATNAFLELGGTMTVGSFVNVSNMLDDIGNYFSTPDLESDIADCDDLLSYWLGS